MPEKPANEIFKFANSILGSKEYLMLTEQDEKDYNAFLTNRACSQHIDAIMYANEINQYPGLPAKLAYDYLFHSIRKMRRKYAKWPKRLNDDQIKLLMAYYQVSRPKAETFFGLLTEDQLKQIAELMEQGGERKSKKVARSNGTTSDQTK